jgi:molecular chaperone GrpE (heat shock protein)
MHVQKDLKLSKWIFFLADLLLVGAAGAIYYRSSMPLGIWHAGFIGFSVTTGAFLSILPFILEYRLMAKLAEVNELTEVVTQIKDLERIGELITTATSRWQGVQEVADRVAGTSKAIAERMSAEAKAFTEFLHKANDSEKATLRLEAEKWKRAEAEWMQVLVRMLDHVYALHLGAIRSGQPNVIAQVNQFQHACRDAARRIGLTPFAANAAEPFDAQRHQVMDGHEAPSTGGTVAETLATGYTFQGRLLRPALVRLEASNGNGNGGPTNGKNESAVPERLVSESDGRSSTQGPA